jgi:formylmethanofuran dehydrogenase subunit E
MEKRISLREAAKFHGHLGPYLVLGLAMGELAVKRLKCRKHFCIEAIVKGALSKPKSCLVDGIQLSTGCTYGKGNIAKCKGREIRVMFRNLRNNEKIMIGLKKDLINRLGGLRGHRDSEIFARKLFKADLADLFEITGG